MSVTFRYDEISIGDEIPGPELRVTREAIEEFAAASFDHNPLHWDDKFLRETKFTGDTQFDDVIMHGLMTYSLMTRAMTDWLWPDNGNHRRLETRFRKPIYPGDATFSVERFADMFMGYVIGGFDLTTNDGQVRNAFMQTQMSLWLNSFP